MSRDADEAKASALRYIEGLKADFKSAKSNTERERILRKMDRFAPPKSCNYYRHYTNGEGGDFIARPTNIYEHCFFWTPRIVRFYERPYQSASVKDLTPIVKKGFEV